MTHNLFGDTDTANVRMDADGGYTLQHQRRGDTTDVMLDYVGYSLDGLRESYRAKVTAAGLGQEQSALMLAALEAGLTGYTYLHESTHE